MATYLVTGGAGFIGSHLVEALVSQGHQVRVLDNLSSGKTENLEKVANQISLIQADAADEASMACLDGVTGIFHLASCSSVQLSMENPALNQRSGEIATLNVLTHAAKRGVKRVVFSSSASVYGDHPESPLREDLQPRPQSPYAVSKLAGEFYARVFARAFKPLDTVSLRYFNAYGPRQDPSNPYSGVISLFLDRLRRKAAPVIFGDGRQTRDFISVHDVVQANLLAMNHSGALEGECFNVATGQSVSILELWSQLCKISGLDLEPSFAAPRPGDIRHSSASIEKIRKALGFSPSKSFAESLRALADSEAIPAR